MYQQSSFGNFFLVCDYTFAEHLSVTNLGNNTWKQKRVPADSGFLSGLCWASTGWLLQFFLASPLVLDLSDPRLGLRFNLSPSNICSAAISGNGRSGSSSDLVLSDVDDAPLIGY